MAEITVSLYTILWIILGAYLVAGVVIMLSKWNHGDWGISSLKHPLILAIFILEVCLWPIILLAGWISSKRSLKKSIEEYKKRIQDGSIPKPDKTIKGD